MKDKDENFEQLKIILDDVKPWFNQAKKRESMKCLCFKRRDALIVDDNIFNIVTLQTLIETNFHIKCDRALNG